MRIFRLAIIIASTVIVMKINGQSIWLEASLANSNPVLVNRYNDEVQEAAKSNVVINFHETRKLSKCIDLPLTKSDYSQCQIFSVYQSENSNREGLIWKFLSKNKDILLTTDHRTVDFTKGKYMNYIDFSPLDPQIHTYQQYRNDFSADVFSLGGKPSRNDIPITSYQGSLAELIAFDRVLAPTAKQAVESYLALKYSIPLTTGMDYVDANGKVLWDYEKNKSYAHNVAGLGRYVNLKLHQKQSQSGLSNGTITFGIDKIQSLNKLNLSVIPDGSYLIWSDDNQPIDFKKENGKPERLCRTWKVNSIGKVGDHLSFILDHEGLNGDRSDQLELWLAWDYSGDNVFSAEHTFFYPMSEIDNALRTDQIKTPDDHESYFTIIKAPKLFATIDLEKVDCKSQQNGAISFKVHGGRGPFEVELISDKKKQGKSIGGNKLYRFENLDAGYYTLSIKDAQGQSWSESFYLNSSFLTDVNLPQKRVVYSDQEILTVKNDPSLIYKWTSPSSKEIMGNSITASEKGIYTLEISNGDCRAWYIVDVVLNQSNIIKSILSPNPTTDGYFKFDATLKESAPYTIVISHLSGTEIFRKDFESGKYISFQNQILQNGMYLISMISGNELVSKKLVVNY